MNEGGSVAQAANLITCYKTYTNEGTHDIVRRNAHRLPAYESGGGKGAGPRYCPSLYSKVERFGDRQASPAKPTRAPIDSSEPTGLVESQI